MTWRYDRADHGHIALGGEIDLAACRGEFILAIAFGNTPEEAGLHALLSLNSSFDSLTKEFVQQWESWHKGLENLHIKEHENGHVGRERNRPDRSRPRATEAQTKDRANLYRQSMMVLQAHRSMQFAGAGVASLSIPWGEMQGDDSWGYHLVWSRDLVEEAIGLLAGGVAAKSPTR